MTEVRLVHKSSADSAPAIEIRPQGFRVEVGPWKDRGDGKCEMLICFIVSDDEIESAPPAVPRLRTNEIPDEFGRPIPGT